MEKDLTKTPLIESIKYDYNNIIKEIHRRFPPLVDDVNLQPKVMRK